MLSGSDGSAGRTSRRAAVAIALILLAATAAAFAYTERQKLARGTISKPKTTHFFSPVCECEKATATVGFRLAKPETVTVRILTGSGRSVRTLVRRRRLEPGTIRFEWDGRTDAGRLAPDGRYRVVIHTGKEDTTLVFPQRIVLDTVAPVASIERVSPSSASPGEQVVVTYELSEAGQPILYVDGVEAALGERGRRGKIEWDGSVDGAAAEPGPHELSIAGRDLAGNVGPRSAPEPVLILS